jgi:hypothetical protein
MTLTDIANRLLNISMDIEKFTDDEVSEELLVLVDHISDIEVDITGTIAGIAKGLKDFENDKIALPPYFQNILQVRLHGRKDIC